MSTTFASEAAVTTWRENGWVLLEGLIPTEVIDAATADLALMFPTAEQYHSDPEGETRRRLGSPLPSREEWVWPPKGPGFRPEQHTWLHEFPFPGSGSLNRLCVHPAIVDFMQRALLTTDLRLYQVRANAKYTGLTNYEQPMHTDRNHSFLPPLTEPPWLHVESFLYLSDVDEGTAPTHLVPLPDSTDHSPTEPLIMPEGDPKIYAAERPATGVRGSLLAYRPDVFHRGVDLTDPGGSRFLLNVSFKSAGQDWIGYDSIQPRANSSDWDRFAEASNPEELALFGFPRPGHPIWDEAMLDATALRYPNLDLTPWRAAARK
jgi:hypothetical protein